MKRKYFGTDGIRGCVGESLINAEFCLKLGWAAGKVLGNGGNGKVLIGKDTRVSGYMLESALAAGLSAAGMNIHMLGPIPTPGIAYLTRTLRGNAGIVISASHNLYQDNGIKFISNQGTKLSDDLERAIEEQLEQKMVTVKPEKLGKATRVVDAAGRYIEFCKSTVAAQLSLKGMKIVVDCANGASYHVAPNVFHELGAQVIKIGNHPDGFNINKDCGSTHPELLQKTVLAEKADVGIAFDGDADRVIMVDHQGEVVDGDELLFIMAQHAKNLGQLRGGIIGTSMSNLGLEEALKKLDIDFKRTNVGDRYVLAALKEMKWLLGGEASGHIVHLGLTTTGDGIIAALQVLAAIQNGSHGNRTLAELKRGMTKYPQILINVPITQPMDIQNQPKLLQAVKEAEQQLGHTGRVLLRASGTEPVVRVMVEGRDHAQVNLLAQALANTVAAIATS